MTESASPPPRESLRAHLRRAARVARFIAALLVTGVSIRFAVFSVQQALASSRANFAAAPVPHAADAAKGAPTASLEAPPVPAPNPSGSGQPLRITLGVNYGPPRSEVYVNGSRVGNAPFLGDTSCKSGQPIRIEIVPDRGPPLTYLRQCRGSSIGINGPPP